jgi:Lrp/AsnC family leucine-responsive transcriptional regulator
LKSVPPKRNVIALSRSSPVPLDEIDLDLLDLLQHDVARTLRELGEAVRLSPSAVHRRLARYDSSGLIERRVAILDSQSVGGRQLAVVLVTLEEQSSQHVASLRARLLATPEVQQCYDVAGEWTTSSLAACTSAVSSSNGSSSTSPGSSASSRSPSSTRRSAAWPSPSVPWQPLID